MIKCVLIDLDDTLWATRENNRDCLEELFHAYGWERIYGNFPAFFAQYHPNNLLQWELYRNGTIDKRTLSLNRFGPLLRPLGYDTEEKILQLNEEFLALARHKTKVMPGAVELLKYLHSLYTVVIVSNGFREVQRDKMEAAGLLPYIDYTILSEDAGASKPHRAIFDYVFSVTGMRRSESIMIGDAWEADILGASRSGIPAIWYNPTGSPRPDDKLRVPLYEVDSLEKIPPLLRTLLPV